VLSLIFFGFAGYTYRVNSKRTADDSTKKDYHPAAIFLTPLWPVFLFASISLFILRAMAYSIFLVLFTIGLVVFRKPFILTWLSKIALKIGDKLLQANTLLVRLFLPQWKPRTA